MSLKTFLQSRNNANVMERILLHMQKILETVAEFERGFEIYVREKNFPIALQIFNRVDKLENEADTLRRDLLIQISQSEFATQMREDLSQLINQMDRIANTADDAARHLISIPENHIHTLGENILEKMLDTIHLSVESAKILFNLIRDLPHLENSEVFRICEKIQQLEHRCDILNWEIYGLLNQLSNLPFNAFEAIQISAFIDLLEMITDRIEDVSDYIGILKTAKR